MATDHLAGFAAVFAMLFAVHKLGDHWVQSQRQAVRKGGHDWLARRACAAHVATYTLVCVTALLILDWCTGLALHPVAAAVGLGVNAVSHYVADRRTPLRRLALRLGQDSYLQHATVVRQPGAPADTTGPGTALFHLDESWHIAWLAVTALIIA